ncbi:hypothetical protein D3C77_520810 [compost metagenome]
MLTDKRGGTLGHPRLFGEHFGLGRIDSGLQVFGVEPGQDLIGLHMVADIDAAGDDLAAHAKRLIRLHPRLDITSEGHGSSKIAGLNTLYAHSGQLDFGSALLATAR